MIPEPAICLAFPPISFRVAGTPKGQPRPRAFARGGMVRVYDPGTAEGWKSIIALTSKPFLKDAHPDKSVDLTIDFWFKRPKAHFKADGSLKPMAPTFFKQKPDLDNLEKAVLDCLTVVGFWKDDCQVVHLQSTKNWASSACPEGCVITIEYIEA